MFNSGAQTLDELINQSLDPLTTSLDDLIKHARMETEVVKKPLLDPCTTALDDIIENTQRNKCDTAKVTVKIPRNPTMKRKQVEETSDSAVTEPKQQMIAQTPQRQFSYLTAYRAVGFLSEKGMIIEITVGRLIDGYRGNPHLWRCIVKCGVIQGVADSCRKVVAREMACDNFLAQLGANFKDVSIPKYTIMDELFIDPGLFQDLKSKASLKTFDVTHELRVKPCKDGKRALFYIFVCTYYVGKHKFKGEHFLQEYAKLRGAKEAYKFVTGRYPEPTKYFVGGGCDSNGAYDFRESEVFQTVADADNEQLAIDLCQDPCQAKIENARREVLQTFKKTKKEEHERRRNMPVDFAIMSGSKFNF